MDKAKTGRPERTFCMNEGSASKGAVFGFAASFANRDGSWNIFPIPDGSAAPASTTKNLSHP